MNLDPLGVGHALQTTSNSIAALATQPIFLKGLAQAGEAALLALVVLGISRLRGLHLEGEMARALVRGFLQILAMGAVIGLLLAAPLPWSGVILLAMLAGATWITRNRVPDVPGGLQASAVGLAAGAGLVIVSMTAVGAIEATVRNLVPVGSMIIAFAMRTNSLTLERFTSEVAGNRDTIEAGLALGGAPNAVIAPHVRKSVRAALIPTLDSLRSLGLVWIPGMMAGMVLAGADPLYAAAYQFVIMAMIFAAGGLASLFTSWLLSERVFTEAMQLRRVEAEA